MRYMEQVAAANNPLILSVKQARKIVGKEWDSFTYSQIEDVIVNLESMASSIIEMHKVPK